MTGWRDYQQQVADFFLQLGFSAEVEADVQGVRALHNIDVWVTFKHYGINHSWIIECKEWKRPVKKEQVLALLEIINDVGADRGFLVAESGFQSGAIAAAKSTNVVLTSLTTLQTNAKVDLRLETLVKISLNIKELMRRIEGLLVCSVIDSLILNKLFYSWEQWGPWGWTAEDALEELSNVDDACTSLRIRGFPVYIFSPEHEETTFLVERDEEFINYSNQILGTVEKWVVSLENAIEKLDTQNKLHPDKDWY